MEFMFCVVFLREQKKLIFFFLIIIIIIFYFIFNVSVAERFWETFYVIHRLVAEKTARKTKGKDIYICIYIYIFFFYNRGIRSFALTWFTILSLIWKSLIYVIYIYIPNFDKDTLAFVLLGFLQTLVFCLVLTSFRRF
jgi:hypothetical protein